MGGRNIFLPGRFFPRKFPDFSGGVEETANPGHKSLMELSPLLFNAKAFICVNAEEI